MESEGERWRVKGREVESEGARRGGLCMGEVGSEGERWIVNRRGGL